MSLRPRVGTIRRCRGRVRAYGACLWLFLAPALSCTYLFPGQPESGAPPARVQPPVLGSEALPAIPDHPPVEPEDAGGPAGETSPSRPAEPPAPYLTTATVEQKLAEVLERIVDATEQNDPRLREVDLEIDRINHEMTDLYFSVGWDLELESRDLEVDATRRETREGRTYRLDGTPRKAHRFYGDLDESLSESTIRLQRQWGHPDHEMYVKIALLRLEKFDAVIQKQELRREVHLVTLGTIVDVVSRQALLPLLDERIRLAREKYARLEQYHKRQEVLRGEVLDARSELEQLQWQRSIHQGRLGLSLSGLRQAADVGLLDALTTLPLAARLDAPPLAFDAQQATSYALERRLDHFLGQWRVNLTNTLAKYMAWYWPTLDFRVWWMDYHGHQDYLDEHRREKGEEFGTQLTLEVPLNLLMRGRARQQAFQAQRDHYVQEQNRLRAGIEQDVREAYLARLQAHADLLNARRRVERAVQEARELRELAARLPQEIQGIPEVRLMESDMEVLDERMLLCLAEHALFRAQATWNYVLGNSPIDTAVEPYLALERRAVEKTKWWQWWTSLIK